MVRVILIKRIIFIGWISQEYLNHLCKHISFKQTDCWLEGVEDKSFPEHCISSQSSLIQRAVLLYTHIVIHK